MDLKNIDWLNHSIAFAASVVGIFIAFQLDDWQERRSRNEQLQITMRGIKGEIEGNLAIYYENDSLLHQFISYVDFRRQHLDNGTLLCTDRDLGEARRLNPVRLHDLKILTKVNDTIKRYEAPLVFDFLPNSGISTANWDAARSTGVLVNIDHDRAVLLTQVYEWTNKRLGISDEELQNSLFSLGELKTTEQVLHDYDLMMRSYDIKYRKVRMTYDQIKW
jgi:hypothetical protein